LSKKKKRKPSNKASTQREKITKNNFDPSISSASP